MSNYFAEEARISRLASIEVSERGTHFYVGAGSVVDDFVKVKHVGGSGHIKLGSRVYINSGTVLYSGNGITIEDNVAIGPNCSLTPVNHEFRDRNKLIMNSGFQPSKGGIHIESDVWIGAGSILLDGTYIEQGAVVGAGSLVKGRLEAYGIYVGAPCQIIGRRK
jgi:virginiamycin A acetyltransferase